MKNINIYTVTHKNFNLDGLFLDDCYRVIRVGKYGENSSDFISDREGDTIWEKNPNYCELTALYWAWKNDDSSDYVGLCHYRRYFTKYHISRSNAGILKKNDYLKLLNKNDILVPKKEYSYRGVYKAYLDCGFEKDLLLTQEAIENLYPCYLNSFKKCVLNSAGNYPANMYVMSKDLSDKYCKWLFDILAYVEDRCDLTYYSQQEARIYGYLSERLLGVWIDYNCLKVKEIRIINTEDKRNFNNLIVDILSDIKIYQLVKILIFRFLSARKKKENK